MKGVNLARVARAQAPGTPLAVPLTGASIEVVRLHSPLPDDEQREVFYLALEGELVVDMPLGQFAHLTPGDSVTVPAGTSRRLCPVGEAVILRVTAASEKLSL
jgi:mannose-6-phosphate isomerase-like protein (cupin superfamily)